jgi:glucose-1-phosphate adenylyltransferase
MVNSGMNNVGIIVKQKYRSLMDHLRSGKEWDLARKRDGLFILPPPDHIHYSNSIYKGDLEHLHHHVDFLARSGKEYVFIACSHMIYNINFREAFQYHLGNQADITVLYKPEEHGAGKSFPQATVLNVAADGRVTDMEVKTGRVSGGNISLDAFILSRKLLLQIIEDGVARGEFDFSKEGVIKQRHKFKIYGFPFQGYVAKINSIPAYYKAHMDLLNPEVWQELFLTAYPIFTKVMDAAPANYREAAAVSNSMVANGCIIEGRVENSILFRGVRVHKGAHIKNSVIMQNNEICADALLENIICDKDVKVTDGKRLIGDKNYVMVIEKGMVI